MNKVNNHLPSEAIRPLPSTQSFNYDGQQVQEEETGVRFFHYLKLIDRYRSVVIGTTILSIMLGLLYIFTATPLYLGNSKVQIGSYEPILAVGRMEGLLSQRTKEAEYLQTQINEITSLSVADRVLKNDQVRGVIEDELKRSSWLKFLGLGPTSDENLSTGRYEHPITQLEAFLKRVRINPIRKTTLVEIQVADQRAETAAFMANTLAEEYIDWVRDTRVDRQSKGLEFLTKQQIELKKKVTDLAREMANYAEENSIIAVNKDENVVVQKMAQLNKMLVEATKERIEAEKLYEEIASTSSDETISFDDPALQRIRTEMSKLEAKRAQLLNKYTPKYPKVKQLEAEISGLKSSIDGHLQKLVRGLKVKAEAAKEKENNLKEEFEQQQSQAFELSKKEVQFNALKRELNSTRELLSNVTRQIEETGLSVESNASNVSLVDYAVAPRRAAYPRKVLVIVLSLIGGLGFGVLIALSLNALDNTVHGPEELEEILRIPNLGVVPTFELLEDGTTLESDADTPPTDPIEDDQQQTSQPQMNTESNANLSVIANENNSLIHQEFEIQFCQQPGSLASEAYRTIRTGILLSQAGEPPKTVLFTSAQSSEGKSTLSANIGASLASTGARVVLIDCDLRRPSLTKVFLSEPKSIGLAELLTGQCDISDVLIEDCLKNISVIPSGRIPPNPAELLGSEQMAITIDALARKYDYVLIDSPPVLPVTDAVVLSKLVDGVVFVVKGDVTPKKIALDAKNRLTNVGARILGTVLNDVDLKKRAYGYYNRYHYSYYREQQAANG